MLPELKHSGRRHEQADDGMRRKTPQHDPPGAVNEAGSAPQRQELHRVFILGDESNAQLHQESLGLRYVTFPATSCLSASPLHILYISNVINNLTLI